MSDLPDILDDGTPFDDLKAAIQAAWIAGERDLAAELAHRYGLYNKVCLRCAGPWTPQSRAGDSNEADCWPETVLKRLCWTCAVAELRPAVKPVIGTHDYIDWRCQTHSDKPIDLKPLLAQLQEAIAKLPPVTLVTVARPTRR